MSHRDTGPQAAEPRNAVRRENPARAILLGVPLIVLNCWWLMKNWGRAGYASAQSFPTIVSLYYNAIFSLLALLGLNVLLRRLAPRLALREAEFLTIYIMLTVASSVAGHDMLEILWPMVAYATWFATPENRWTSLQAHIPDWLTVKDREKVAAFYLGNANLHTTEHLRVWQVPVLAWSVLMLLLGLMMLCLVALLRDRWVRQEKLAYPNIQLPLALTDPAMRLFRNRLLWAGLLLAGGMDLVNGLHDLYPSVPSLGGALHQFNAQAMFRSPPYTAIGFTPVALYPFAVGMTYFIPLDLSFSVWCFYLINKAGRVLAAMFGAAGETLAFTGEGDPTLMVEQAAGAWIGLALVAVWSSRHYLREQWQAARQGRPAAADAPMSSRVALLGLGLGTVGLLLFGSLAGAGVWQIVVFFFLFFALSLAITRVRAELGPPTHDIHAHPTMMMVTALGSERIGMPSLTLFSFFNAFNRTYRCHPMPCMLEAFAMAARRNLAPRPLLAAMVVALVTGTLASAWAFYAHGYTYGGAIVGEQNQCRWYFNQLTVWKHSPAEPRPASLLAMLVGGGVTFGLMALRHQFTGWPLHPAGYAISLGLWNTNWFWFSMFIGWLLKWLVMRGGLRFYRQAMPFFFGLVLGEFIMGATWSLIGITLGIPTYRFLS